MKRILKRFLLLNKINIFSILRAQQHLLLLFVFSSMAFGAESEGDVNYPSNPKVNHYLDKAKEAQATYAFIQADLYLDTAMIFVLGEGSLQQKGEVYLQKGIVKKSLSDFGASLDFFINALAFFEEDNDSHNRTRAYVNLAEFYRKTVKYEQATEFIEKAKDMYSAAKLDDLVLLNKIYNRSAAINNEFNPDPSFSLGDSRKALSIAQKIPDSSLMAVSYNELGFTYKNLINVDSSEYFYLEAERIWMATGEYAEALHVRSNRAQLYLHNNYDKNSVIELYKNIVKLSDSLQVDFPMINVSWILYTLYLEKGDTISAFNYFRKHHDEALIMFNTKTRNELHNVNARFQNEKIQNEFNQVSEKLSESNLSLEKNQKQQFFLIVFLAVLLLSFLLIFYLFFRLRKYTKDLADKNAEKDSLIQEVHHRVKNNLQFISSLINMQLNTATSKKEEQSLNETSRRIKSMALVHEMLYNRADQKGISAKYYLEELIDSLYAFINSDDQKILFEMELVDIDLNVSDTISIGMITSEIISNSMKHAFDNQDSPLVRITLKETSPNCYTYSITDNGKGFKKVINIESTLGLRLIDIFSRQLKGQYTISGDKGFEYSLNFKTK